MDVLIAASIDRAGFVAGAQRVWRCAVVVRGFKIDLLILEPFSFLVGHTSIHRRCL